MRQNSAVVHVELTEEQRTQQFMGFGIPEFRAKLVTFLEVSSASGAENKMNDTVEQVTGRPPQNFDAFVQEHRSQDGMAVNNSSSML